MNKDHYQQLALPPTPRNLRKRHPRNSEIDQHIDELKSLVDDIETNELREKMKQTMEKITYSWSKKHDSLIDALARLEKSQKRTQVRLSSQALQYERAIRDVQAYRTRYENCVLLKRQTSSGSNPKNFRRRSAIALSNGSSLSGKSITSTQSSPRSSSSSTPTTFSFMDDIIDSVNYNSEVDEELSLDLCSDQETPFTATPSSPPPSSYNDTDSLISREDQQFIFSAASCEDNQENVLKFGCGEGFWDTIANSRTNKQEVDELISKYLQRGGNPNVSKNSDTVKNVKEGYGLIHALVAVRNTSALHRIINAGAKANVYPLTNKTEDKIHPLVLAAKLGYTNGVRLLIEQGGANILTNKGPLGETVLHAAIQSNSDELVGYLLRISQNTLLDKTDDAGATPLHYACLAGRTRLITLFVRDCQAKGDPRDQKGETPLHYAVRNRKARAVVNLVGELGIYPNPYILKQVPTPLDLAKSNGCKPIAEYLKQSGGKTTKEMEKANKTLANGGQSNETINNDSQSPTLSVRHFLHTKTSQILRGHI